MKAVIAKKEKSGNVSHRVFDVTESPMKDAKFMLRTTFGTVHTKSKKGLENYLKRRFKGYDSVNVFELGEFPKHKGNGSYELSTGETAGNKKDAAAAEPTLTPVAAEKFLA